MRALIILPAIFAVACGTKPEITIEEFVERQNTTAKEYVPGLFGEHDLVVISE